MVTIDKKYVIQRQGKDHVLFAGLLDAAHAAGLKSIRTRLLQAPSAENGDTTICAAEVEMDDGRVFCGIGDANAANVGTNIRVHAIRMAETRSKARALRDALNIGGAALEELGGDDDGFDNAPEYPPRQHAARPAPIPVSALSPTPPRQEAVREPAVMQGNGRQPRGGAAEIDALFDEKPVTSTTPADSPLREEVRALHAKVVAVYEFRSTKLPADDAPDEVWSRFIDYWTMQLENRARAAERRAQSAGARAR